MAQAVLRAGSPLRDFSMSPHLKSAAELGDTSANASPNGSGNAEEIVWRVPEFVLDEMQELALRAEPWFFYGSAGALAQIRERDALRPWIRFDETAFGVAAWRERLRGDLGISPHGGCLSSAKR